MISAHHLRVLRDLYAAIIFNRYFFSDFVIETKKSLLFQPMLHKLEVFKMFKYIGVIISYTNSSFFITVLYYAGLPIPSTTKVDVYQPNSLDIPLYSFFSSLDYIF